MPEPRYSWTQPSCSSCWAAMNPGRKQVAVKDPCHEKCVYCGASTKSGIYVRVDPKLALHPTITKD